LNGLSDHTLITTTLPTCNANRDSTASKTGEPQIIYKWIEGTHTKNYANAANSWMAHTQTQEFIKGLEDIINEENNNNDQRAAAVEDYILQ
jgi:hypothetical protein